MLTKPFFALSTAFVLTAAPGAMAMTHAKKAVTSNARAEASTSASVGSHLAGDDALFRRAKGHLY